MLLIKDQKLDERELKAEIERVDNECRVRFDKLENFVDRIRNEQISCPVKEVIKDIIKDINLIKGKVYFFYILAGLFSTMVFTMIGLHVKDYSTEKITPAHVKQVVQDRMDKIETKLEQIEKKMRVRTIP